MGDGTLGKNSKNACVKAKMTSPEYLEYLDCLLDNESLGVRKVMTGEENARRMRDSGFRPNANGEDYKDVYVLRSRCHPDLNQFRDWYTPDGKVWPNDIDLTSTVLTHLYVCDGHWACNGSRNNITISAVNERENKDKVTSLFTKAGLPEPLSWGEGEDVCYARWSAEDSEVLFDYMDGPLPDFEYKFPN